MIHMVKYGKWIQLVAFLVGIGFGLRTGLACGDFQMPSNHFEGVSSRGYVSIWKQLDTLPLGNSGVPILIGCQTYRSIPSGELGAGWIMPLLDSGIVQRDHNTYDMISPDGTMDYFISDRSNPKIFQGSSGWTAELKGKDFNVYSKCGSGWKMVYRDGKLETLSKGDHEFKIQRDSLNRPIAITENGENRMKLTRDEKTGLMSAMEVNGKKYLFAYEGRPKLKKVASQNVVEGTEPSLHQIIYPDGKKETYNFAVNDKNLPNVKITDTEGNERIIVWGTDGRVLQDGEWTYDIKPNVDPRGNAAIGRTNPQKQKEYWFSDDENGKETTVALDGTKTERTWFTSGPAHGKIRKVVQTAGGVKKVVQQCSYDDKGKLIREIFKNGSISNYKNESHQMTTTTFQKDALVAIQVYDEIKKRVTEITSPGIFLRKFKYRSDNLVEVETTYFDSPVNIERTLINFPK